ncbi:MAG: 50S ribosomal protein L6 [Alphaproteobacteria bacterium]|nr:50S ribosomal protein L6 [Alphaproteobacteria bacterium]
MSRVGKNPVSIPSGVTVKVANDSITAKGKLGEITFNIDDLVNVSVEDNNIFVKPTAETKESRIMWGTSRNLIRNMVTGVSVGYNKVLEIEGVGYRAAVQGKNLQLQLGFSHDVIYPIPENITIKCEKPTTIVISGSSKQKVGQVAAEIRSFRPPEPYKGKGIRYSSEFIRRKEGKKK